MNHLKILEEVRDFIFVPRCYACDQLLVPSMITNEIARCFCTTCMESLIFSSSPKCSLCAEPFAAGAVDHLCSTCLTHRPKFDGVVSVFEYGGALANAMLRYKYTPATYMARGLGKILCTQAADDFCIHFDVVIPIPLHPKRLRHRGFNQSALLAGMLAKNQKMPLTTDTLFRRDDTASQVGKGKKDRIQNMRGAYTVRDKKGKMKGKRILLVDDVVTTTATIRSAATVLKRDGFVASVHVICLGRSSTG